MSGSNMVFVKGTDSVFVVLSWTPLGSGSGALGLESVGLLADKQNIQTNLLSAFFDVRCLLARFDLSCAVRDTFLMRLAP